MAPGLGDTIAFCNPSADFAALRFYFPDGDNIAHYITFNPQADPFCAGQEGCNELFPWMYEGNIESNCLGAQGAVRADYFSEYQRCTIYFQHND